MTNAAEALIVGAGVAGSATALALHKAGIEARICEAHPHSAEGTGAFLTLATNGIDALRALDADVALEAGFPTPWIALRSTTGKALGRTPTGLALPDGTHSHTLKRSDLYLALHQRVTEHGIAVEYGQRLIGVHDAGDQLRAEFADGSEVPCRLLIGCDGVHSTVRGLIDPDAPAPRYEGLLTTGGYVRGVPVSAEPGCYEMIFGRRAFFGYIVTPDGEVWWFANVPRRREPSRTELAATAPGQLRRQLLELFAGDAGPALGLVEATREIMPLSPIHTLPRLRRWHRDGMIVIGDAAHAPSPTSGQGASLSIEDAAVLALCLRDAGHRTAVALARFEATRRPRVERIVKWAARINNSKAPSAPGRIARDLMLPAILRMTANSKAHHQTFDHHIEWTSASGAIATRA